MDEISIATPWGILTLKKTNNAPLFGQTVVCFLPKHGDFNCYCASCSLYRISDEYKKKGYTAIKFIESKE